VVGPPPNRRIELTVHEPDGFDGLDRNIPAAGLTGLCRDGTVLTEEPIPRIDGDITGIAWAGALRSHIRTATDRNRFRSGHGDMAARPLGR